MSPNDLAWIGLTILQMIGMGVVLAVVGFGYDKAIREKAGLLKVIESDALIGWLALGMVIFTIGLLLGEANWLQKIASVGITFILGWMAWQSRKL